MKTIKNYSIIVFVVMKFMDCSLSY